MTILQTITKGTICQDCIYAESLNEYGHEYAYCIKCVWDSQDESNSPFEVGVKCFNFKQRKIKNEN